MHKTRLPITHEDEDLVRKKVVPVQLKDYIKVGSAISPIHYFYVKEGLYTIRMVYNVTGCRLYRPPTKFR